MLVVGVVQWLPVSLTLLYWEICVGLLQRWPSKWPSIFCRIIIFFFIASTLSCSLIFPVENICRPTWICNQFQLPHPPKKNTLVWFLPGSWLPLELALFLPHILAIVLACLCDENKLFYEMGACVQLVGLNFSLGPTVHAKFMGQKKLTTMDNFPGRNSKSWSN